MNEAVLVAIGGLVTAILGALGMLLKQVWQQKQKGARTATRDYAAVFDRQEKRIARLEEQNEEQQQIIDALNRERLDCQVGQAEIYGDLVAMHDTACRHAVALTHLGQSPGDVPPLRPRPQRHSAELDYRQRSAEQNARLLKATDPPTPLPPTTGGT